MSTPPAPEPRYHVLLVGIDAYGIKPLDGCVNDIDAIQALLLGPRIALPPSTITRLASPHPDTEHPPAEPATLANIRAALARLGSDAVASGDRVLIYYSGHGTRAPVSTPAGVFHREALVPVDFDAQPGQRQLLFDFELNAALAAILARTAAVTVVLDCCHSAGATRAATDPDTSARTLDCRRDLANDTPLEISAEAAPALETARGVAVGMDGCQVVTACLNHELAQESTVNGVRHGLLTRALVRELDALPAEVSLREVPWGRIWQAVQARVQTANPMQHVWMAGSLARAVIAGPPVDADVGLTIARKSQSTYSINAGTLASVTPGALVAVYGDTPARFPALGSDEDAKARIGDVLLRVENANLAVATAEAEGAPFELPPGARGRLVKAGSPARLRCAVVPRNDAVEASLRASPLLEVVDAGQAEARLEYRAAGEVWVLTDDIHGAKPDYPVLCTLRADQLDVAAEVLEQYFAYALPLRMAASCRDRARELEISVLRCPAGELTEDQKDGIGLPEAGSQGAFTYDVAAGDRSVIRIRNAAKQRLKVILLNCAASGRVEYLGDQIIEAGAFQMFWRGNLRGNPFPMTTPRGATQGIDRLVAVGTTALDADLRYLKSNTKFSHIIDRARTDAPKDLDDDDGNSPPRDLWTATQAVIRCQAR